MCADLLSAYDYAAVEAILERLGHGDTGRRESEWNREHATGHKPDTGARERHRHRYASNCLRCESCRVTESVGRHPRAAYCAALEPAYRLASLTGETARTVAVPRWCPKVTRMEDAG